ncbi:MAG: hypothetical protein U9N59_03460 [Campylobacterota bacterium]|nr:hypothetical protein [Campylobacterota bacterium]
MNYLKQEDTLWEFNMIKKSGLNSIVNLLYEVKERENDSELINKYKVFGDLLRKLRLTFENKTDKEVNNDLEKMRAYSHTVKEEVRLDYFKFELKYLIIDITNFVNDIDGELLNKYNSILVKLKEIKSEKKY